MIAMDKGSFERKKKKEEKRKKQIGETWKNEHDATLMFEGHGP